MLPETMGGTWGSEEVPGLEELDPNEEMKDDPETISKKLFEIKQGLSESNSFFLYLEFPIFGSGKHVPADHKMLKIKTMDLPPVSSTPVNTLVDEEEEGEMPKKEES